MVKCCKDCEKRHKNCHSTCKVYKKEAEDTRKENRWLQEQKEANDNINGYEYNKANTSLKNKKPFSRYRYNK